MKTRYILAALALPAIFAACSNEDFMETQNPVIDNPALEGRETFSLALNADKDGVDVSADTRMHGKDDDGKIQWWWDGANDKIGAFLVDYNAATSGDLGVIVDADKTPNYVITNYPFAPQIQEPAQGANFKTPTAVVEGAYMFYNKYQPDGTSRRKIEHELPRIQNVKSGIEAGLQQIGTGDKGNNFFISPIVQYAAADGQSTEKPIQLKSIYSVLHLTLKADLDEKFYRDGFKVNKVELRTLGTDDVFYRSLIINPVRVADIQKKVMAENPTLPFLANGAIDGLVENDNAISAAINAVNAAISDPTMPIGKCEDGTTELEFQLADAEGNAEPYVFNMDNKDEAMDLYVLIPTAQYNNGKGTEVFENKEKGIFLLKVYTSEGVFNSYLMSSADSYNFARGAMYGQTKTMIIKGGQTNIRQHADEGSFIIETKADWDYAIEYIKQNFDEYGDLNKWNIPTLEVKDGSVIKVDADHYFPNFPVKYEGDATLMLEGQQSYGFDPQYVILDATKRPVIKIEDQEEAEIVFNEDVKADIKAYNESLASEDGKNITAALKLVTDAKVVIADGVEVNFEKLVSETSLSAGAAAEVNVDSEEDVTLGGNNTFANGATVALKAAGQEVALNNAIVGAGEKTTLSMEGATVETTGTLALNENAVMTVAGNYNNEATATIAAKAEANMGAATNNGSFEVAVTGLLNSTATFINKGTVTLLGDENTGMNDDARSKAAFKVLENSGTIDIQAGGDKKGSYGGELTVAGNVKNYVGGVINVNGEFFAEKATNGVNNGAINLQGNPYAVIRLADGFKSTGNGYILLEDPTQYEMFNIYYTMQNSLTGVKGDIIAELTNDELATVWGNHKEYDKKQETAWEVINKIKVEDVLKMITEQTEGAFASKNLVLLENAGIEAVANNKVLNFNNVVVEGANTKFAGKCTINVNFIDIKANTSFENGDNVKTIIAYNASKTMLNISGQLTNNGTIDTEDSADENTPNNILTLINEGGVLDNNGYLSKKAVAKFRGTGYNAVKTFANAMGTSTATNSPWRGTFGVNVPRVDIIEATVQSISDKTEWNKEDVWNEYTSINHQITAEVFANILNAGVVKNIEGYQALVLNHSTTGWCYALYLGQSKDVETLGNNKDFNTARATEGLAKVAMGVEKMPYPTTTWFYIADNYGTVDLQEGTAWGEIQKGHNFGYKKGDFENDK